MAKLLWDAPGSRLYEVGIDRGAIYLDSGAVVPWNGLTSVDENTSDTVASPIYYDGVKIRDDQTPGDYSATITALTYPDALLDLVGVAELETGLFVDGQKPKRFNLCYRTLIGNDLEGTTYGYKLHLIYNVTAIVDSITYTSKSEITTPAEMSLALYATPEPVAHYRATAHVILDSRLLQEDIFELIEDILYGMTSEKIYLDGFIPSVTGPDVVDAGTSDLSGPPVIDGQLEEFTSDIPPRWISLEELVNLGLNWDPKMIVPNTVTGLAQLVDYTPGELTPTKIPGVLYALPDSNLVATTPLGFYTYVP